MRLVDWLKRKGITAMLADLKTDALNGKDSAISSIVDTWLVLREVESNGERNRGLHILKSRGIRHSNQVREFELTESGIRLADFCIGPNGVLTGSARLTQEAREITERAYKEKEAERQQLALDSKRAALERQIAMLRAEFSAEEAALARASQQGRPGGAQAMDNARMGRANVRDASKTGKSRAAGGGARGGES
jgi:circadian clock protein KaiC